MKHKTLKKRKLETELAKIEDDCSVMGKPDDGYQNWNSYKGVLGDKMKAGGSVVKKNKKKQTHDHVHIFWIRPK